LGISQRARGYFAGDKDHNYVNKNCQPKEQTGYEFRKKKV
jgi:hypothetical protein